MFRVCRFCCYSITAFSICATGVAASPWVEVGDPYLRSDLQLLADAGVIQAPVNTYPLPWRLIAGTFTQIYPSNLPAHLQQAYYHVRYAFDRAKAGRANNRLQVSAANGPVPPSFGVTNHSQWAVRASTEAVGTYFSYRLSANYGDYHGADTTFNFDGSYVGVTNGSFSLGVGSLEHWWGPGWQSNLSLHAGARPVPALFITAVGDDLLGFLDAHFESFWGRQETDSPFHYLWGNRLSLSPLNRVELGISYITHINNNGDSTLGAYGKALVGDGVRQQQTTLDARWGIPLDLPVQVGLYGQWQDQGYVDEHSRSLAGLDIAGNWQRNAYRLAIEYLDGGQVSAADADWITHHNQFINDATLLDSRLSVGGMVQLGNDHSVSLYYHHEKAGDPIDRISGNYQLIIAGGRFSLDLSAASTAYYGDQVQVAAGWDYRF